MKLAALRITIFAQRKRVSTNLEDNNMKKIDDYWVWLACSEKDSAIIKSFPNDGPDFWELLEGEPIATHFPETIKLKFSPSRPDKIRLYDFVNNTLLLRIVSKRVRAIFDQFSIDQVEYIPVEIMDHQGNLASNDYFLMNVMNTQPIIDMKRSKYEMCLIEEDQISDFDEIRLTTDQVDMNASIFRSDRQASLYFMTDDVVQAIKAAGLTGLKVVKAEGWDTNTLSFKY